VSALSSSASSSGELPLKDKWVVVTRPLHQSDNLKAKLAAAGAKVLSFPLLEIVSARDPARVRAKLQNLDRFDLVIFVSANAVEQSLKVLSVEDLSRQKIAAVGKKTAQYLYEKGLDASISPKSIFNSEALLALPEIKKLGQGDKVAIVRGEGGRDYLKEQLEAQGVDVDYINVYRRRCPQSSLDELCLANQQQPLDVIMLTSVQSATNLFDLQSGGVDNAWLSKVTLLVGSERIKSKLLSSKYKTGKMIVADDPSDKTMFERLLSWVNNEGV